MPSPEPHLEALSQSPMYLDFQRAFTQGTGLPLAVHAPQMLGLIRNFSGQQNRFCGLMAGAANTCAACYALQQRLARNARSKATSRTCFAGLSETAVPVFAGGRLLAFLHTGHVLLQPPTRNRFNRVASLLQCWGVQLDLKSVEAAYLQTPVFAPRQYGSLTRLLAIFAGHLGARADELLLQAKKAEPVAITRARQFIHAHYEEALPLARMARVVNTSAAYLSRRFMQAIGVSFVDYIGRGRVEKARRLLQDPSLRISMIALEVGFRSLSQFNRTFRRVTGRAPRELRIP